MFLLASDVNKREIFTKVNSSMENVKIIKAGHSLKSVLEIPDFQETLEWAVSNVQINEEKLIHNFIEFKLVQIQI